MENMQLYNKFKEVPIEAQKTITAGRLKGMTDINPMWRIKCLTEHFGACGVGWYYTVKEKRIETIGTESVVFVDIELFVKVDGEWSKPIYGSGGSKLATQERNGMYVSDECFKMATTDAISVACKQLGIGADVYWQSGRSKYNNTPSNEPVIADGHDGKPRDANLITQEQMGKLRLEMVRTGATEEYLNNYYKLPSILNMTQDQYKNAMANFKKTPDRKNK